MGELEAASARRLEKMMSGGMAGEGDVGKKAATEKDHEIGLRIACMRSVAGLSQSDLGRAIGISFQQVQKYEKGRNRVGASRLRDIAEALGVNVGVFFGEDAAVAVPDAHMDVPGARELLRSYAAIGDADVRRQVLGLVQSAARLNALRD